MGHAALHHAVNGFFDVFKSKPAPAAQPASRAARVKVESRYNEDDEESLLESANSLPRQTLKALEKQLRTDGFKGAMVSGWNQGDRGGFTVHYGGEKYEFEISENVTPRPMGEIGRLVKESGRYQGNGRGAYHGMGLSKNDMVVHEDHRGKWRVDLLTSSSGNFITIGPTTGYADPLEAAAAARREHHKRGLRNGLLYKQQADGGYEMFYWRGPSGLTARLIDEPMEANGRAASPAKVRQDLEASYYYNERKIADAEEELRRPGISPEYRQQLRDMIASAKSDMEYVGSRMQQNGRATTADATAARELDLYIANTYELVGAANSIGKSIDTSLKRKIANGSYDPALATKAWQHLVDEGARRYQRELGSGSPIFNAATRRQVAAAFAREWEASNATEKPRGRTLELTGPNLYAEAAKIPASGRFHSQVFLAPLLERFGTTPQKARQKLLELHRENEIVLSRAELVEAMDPELVRLSAIDVGVGNYKFHLFSPW